MFACPFYRHYNNVFYARIGGISNGELNSLELDFLFRLDFRLHVTSNMFEGYCTYLERELVLTERPIQRSLATNVNENHNHDKQPMVEDTLKTLRLVIDRTKDVGTSHSPTKSVLDA